MTDQSGEFRDMTAPAAEPRKIPWRLIAGLLLFAAIVLFAGDNVHQVRMDFAWWHPDVPLIAIIGIAFVAAWILSDIFSWWWRRRKKAKASQS